MTVPSTCKSNASSSRRVLSIVRQSIIHKSQENNQPSILLLKLGLWASTLCVHQTTERQREVTKYTIDRFHCDNDTEYKWVQLLLESEQNPMMDATNTSTCSCLYLVRKSAAVRRSRKGNEDRMWTHWCPNFSTPSSKFLISHGSIASRCRRPDLVRPSLCRTVESKRMEHSNWEARKKVLELGSQALDKTIHVPGIPVDIFWDHSAELLLTQTAPRRVADS